MVYAPFAYLRDSVSTICSTIMKCTWKCTNQLSPYISIDLPQTTKCPECERAVSQSAHRNVSIWLLHTQLLPLNIFTCISLSVPTPAHLFQMPGKHCLFLSQQTGSYTRSDYSNCTMLQPIVPEVLNEGSI